MSARATVGTDDAMAAPAAGREPLRFGHAEVFAAIFALAFVAARFLPLLDLPYACPFKALTGLPCATCGMTHALVHLAHGAVGAALRANPLGALAAACCWSFVLVDVARLAMARPLPRLGGATARALARAGLIAVIANWAFLVVAHS